MFGGIGGNRAAQKAREAERRRRAKVAKQIGERLTAEGRKFGQAAADQTSATAEALTSITQEARQEVQGYDIMKTDITLKRSGLFAKSAQASYESEIAGAGASIDRGISKLTRVSELAKGFAAGPGDYESRKRQHAEFQQELEKFYA